MFGMLWVCVGLNGIDGFFFSSKNSEQAMLNVYIESGNSMCTLNCDGVR